MAVSNVELRVDSRQAVNALQRTNAASQKLEQSTQKLTNALGQQQQQATRTAQATNSAFGQLITTLGGVAAAYANLRVAQQAVQAGIQREESARRLQFLAKGYNEVTQAQLAAARAGQQFGLSTTESNQQFAQLYGRLRPLNVSIQDVEAAFVGFNTAAKVSGATSAESAGALLQLTQALGSGVLRGQELNSVLEQAPGLVVALTKELGAPISQIRKLAEDGKITSEVVIRALKRAATEGAGQLEAAMQGPSQQIKNLQNAFQDFQVQVAQVIMPAVIGSVKELTRILESATQYVKDFGVGWQIISSAVSSALAPFEGLLSVLGQIDSRLRSIGQQPALNMLAGLLPGGPLSPVLNLPADLGRGVRRTSAGSGMYGRYSPGSAQVPFALGRATVSPAVVDEKAKTKAARETERAAKAAAKEQERVAQVIRDRLAEGQLMQLKSGLQDKIAAAESAGDKQLAVRLKGQEKELDIQYRYAQALAQEKDIRAQEAIIYEGNTALIANQREIQRELTDLQNESARNQIAALESQLGLQNQLTEAQKQQKTVADSLAGTIGEGLTSSFNALIQGSEDFGTSLRRIASGVLIDIANQLLRVFVIQKAINALSGLFGGGGAGGLSYSGVTGSALGTSMLSGNFTATPFSTIGLGFRANGGSVRAGSPYVVGERGPELFMPGRSGGIARTGSFGGAVSVVVNVDAGGTSVEGNEPNANQLGRIVGAAVQAEIVKMQRPGGLLANTR
jgi:tape measure domain-containing protein